VAERVAHRLVSDQEIPRVTVSVGIAVYPQDGSTTETLLSTADQELYAMKASHGAQRLEGQHG